MGELSFDPGPYSQLFIDPPKISGLSYRPPQWYVDDMGNNPFAKEKEFLYGKADEHPEAQQIVKPIRNANGTYGSIAYDKTTGKYSYKDVQGYTPQGERMSDVYKNEVSYGRVVRIPFVREREGDIRYVDVTVKQAKAEAKRLRKLAKQIRKACR